MKLFYEYLIEHSKEYSEKTAALDSFGSMTYKELMGISASLAHKLIALGIKQQDTVAIYVPYRKEVIPGIIAVLCAGGIYVPFDDEYPVKRLEYILEDADIKAVLTTRQLWEKKKLGFPESKVIFIDEIETIDEMPFCSGEISIDSPAMLLYTSGTTGKPKGVLHTQGMLLHMTEYIKSYEGLELNQDTRCGIMSGFSFIATQTFLMGTILHGGTVCIAPDEAKKDMGYLYDFLQKEKITHIFMPSSLAVIFVEDYDLDGICIFTGGEKLKNFRPLSKNGFLINSYGCTETGGILSRKAFGGEESMSVGAPSSYTKTLIVDEVLNSVKAGEAGELLISTDYMAKGYYKQPELGKEKWAELDGKIWFRTGDRAFFLPDGNIELLGRIDNMVKLRGYRIETGEVENRIANAAVKLEINALRQVAVVVRNIYGTEHLCCYYESEKEIDAAPFKAEISQYLPHYMIPDIWVRMDAFPRNANGKILRKELPKPKQKRIINGVPDSEVMARVIYTAEDTLGTDFFIGVGDKFTEIGGNSISAMDYSMRLRKQGIKISGADILSLDNFKEIADKAKVAYEQLWSAEEYEAIRRDFFERGENIEKVLPISPRQDDILFNQLFYPDRSDYMNALMLQVDSIISPEHLREALDIVAKENEELRSAIVYRKVLSVIQQVITDRRIPMELISMDTFDREERDKLRAKFLHEPFDPQYSSMMKVVLVHSNESGRKISFLYILSYQLAVEKKKLKSYVARLMELLLEYYPSDKSISDWIYLMGNDFSSKGHAKKPYVGETSADVYGFSRGNSIVTKSVPDIRIYSENSGPKLVFIHTANSDGGVYYRLADRIRDVFSFAVIEPYNLYHHENPVYGIKNIAAKYIQTLKEYQPQGPYILGGWCYGGIVAHEMACQLESAGDEISHLIMLDSHAISNEEIQKKSKSMFNEISRDYYETCPLFEEIRENGMLDVLIDNAAHVSDDLLHHKPSFFNGNVIYFKPDQIPAGITGANYRYWTYMMGYEAGNYENYCNIDKLTIIHTPQEHDLMMDEPSLDVIVPGICMKVRRGLIWKC
ncbi:AMP-binding protein [Butyrivibrio sp. YAB3001]|uniref:AMP-binding protein n=1 Tax=Butyrivibrio sp. YAB3001 TaxID=1520812 RepID=UPI0008F66A2C|nr:AMP-binding protein [Butyrivibrio sp. YAB3001]SFD03490.1 amino acid adenylation domain-containing protein [Butyrivibrio sp. YAB3001]